MSWVEAGARRWAAAAAIVALVAAWLVALLPHLGGPIRDNDFFWHLSTGARLLATGQLPASDSLAFTSPQPLTPWATFVLHGYWLSQLLIAWLVRICGLGGIALVRLGLALALASLLLWRARRTNALTVSLVGLAVYATAAFFPLERPQSFSFAGFAAALALLDRVRDASGRHTAAFGLVGLPLLFGLWANLHPGFLAGLALLVVAGTVEGGKSLLGHPRRLSRGQWPLFLASLLAAAAASLANPNGWAGWRLASTLDAYNRGANIDYQSMATFLSRYQLWGFLVAWALLLGGAALVAARWRQLDPADSLLLVALGGLAFLHVRYVPFYLVTVTPLLAREVGGWARWRVARGALAALALAVVATLGAPELAGLRLAARGQWIDPRVFPVGAADFLASAAPPGRLYNHFDWGGFLAWRLGPSSPVFVDGRCLVPEICDLSVAINLAQRFPDGTPVWQRVFDVWGVNTVVTSWSWPSGRPLELARELAVAPDWNRLWTDGWAVIFVRGGARPSATPTPSASATGAAPP